MSTLMKEEILSTPELLARTRRSCEPVCREIIARLNPRHLYLACRGSSENAGRYFEYLLETRCHKPVTVIPPSVVTNYGSTVDMSDGLLIVISQGGRGVDLRMVMEEAKRQHVPVAAVTNFPDSPIGRGADFVLNLDIDLEQSMAATKSFTAELYALYLLACALSGDTPSDSLPAAFAEGLSREASVEDAMPAFDTDRPIYVLGRGKTLALARETCCKLQETCLLSAFPFSAADFMHGPFALVEKGSRVIVFHSRFACYDSTLAILEALNAQGAEVLCITDDADNLGCPCVRVKTHSEDESVFAMTAVLQLLAANLSERRGTNPDTSRNLSKYTETV